MAEDAPNYHVSLWEDPPTYVCLLCGGQFPATMTLEEVQAHVTTVHETPPIPTPLAANPSLLLPPAAKESPDAI